MLISLVALADFYKVRRENQDEKYNINTLPGNIFFIGHDVLHVLCCQRGEHGE